MSNKRVLSNNLFELIGPDMTIKDFAKACDIPYNTMLNYFNLHGEPNATNLAKMAAVLGCSVDTLVNGFDLGDVASRTVGEDA